MTTNPSGLRARLARRLNRPTTLDVPDGPLLCRAPGCAYLTWRVDGRCPAHTRRGAA